MIGDRHDNVRAVMDLAEAISEERFEQACLGRASDREALWLHVTLITVQITGHTTTPMLRTDSH
jgi:hypothetical protein